MLTFRAVSRRVLDWLGFGRTDGLRTSVDAGPAESPSDLVEPVYGVDGWTYQGTALEECFPPDVEAELTALTHAVCSGLATPWSYERAARLLERHAQFGQAYAVIAAYLDSGVPPTASLLKWRSRLAEAYLTQAMEAGRDGAGGHCDAPNP